MCNRGCYCNGDPIEAVREAITTCEAGLAAAQSGVEQVTENNTCCGVREISNGLCECQRALAVIQRGLRSANAIDTATRRGLYECCQGLNNISDGNQSICCSNAGTGVANVESGIAVCQQGLERITAAIDDADKCNGFRFLAQL